MTVDELSEFLCAPVHVSGQGESSPEKPIKKRVQSVHHFDIRSLVGHWSSLTIATLLWDWAYNSKRQTVCDLPITADWTILLCAPRLATRQAGPTIRTTPQIPYQGSATSDIRRQMSSRANLPPDISLVLNLTTRGQQHKNLKPETTRVEAANTGEALVFYIQLSGREI